MHPRKIPACVLLCAVLAATGCERKADVIDIPSATAKSALTLSAFECGHLAADKRDSARLFNVGLLNGREFLNFVDHNATGYKSIEPQLDPIWALVADRPSHDFKLGEINAAMLSRVIEYRGRWNDNDWQQRRQALFEERNCAFIGSEKPKA